MRYRADGDMETRKPLTIRVLHWTVALLFVVAIATGFTAFDFSLKMSIQIRDTLFATHRLSGMIVIALMLIWFAARVRQAVRSREQEFRFSATGVFHVVLGLLCIVLPIMPWIARSLDGRASELYAFLPVHNLVSPPTTPWAYWLTHQHKILFGYIAGLLVLHIAGAFYHRFFLKDEVLRAMLFDLRKSSKR